MFHSLFVTNTSLIPFELEKASPQFIYTTIRHDFGSRHLVRHAKTSQPGEEAAVVLAPLFELAHLAENAHALLVVRQVLLFTVPPGIRVFP